MNTPLYISVTAPDGKNAYIRILNFRINTGEAAKRTPVNVGTEFGSGVVIDLSEFVPGTVPSPSAEPAPEPTPSPQITSAPDPASTPKPAEDPHKENDQDIAKENKKKTSSWAWVLAIPVLGGIALIYFLVWGRKKDEEE